MSKEVIWSGSGEQPSGALCVRNIKSREGYDYWDKLCAIPRYGFIHSPDNSRVLKAEGVGNWIDQHAAQEVVDEAQSEVNQLRAENKALLAERDALKRDSERYQLLASTMVADCLGKDKTPQQAALFTTLNTITYVGTEAEFDAVFDAALQGEQP